MSKSKSPFNLECVTTFRFKKIIQDAIGLSFILGFLTACSVNILQEFSIVESDDVLFFDAQKLVTDGQYAAALTKFSSMSSDYQALRTVRVWRASAYLGLCTSKDFLDFLSSIPTITGSNLFFGMMVAFQGGNATKQTNCQSAETELRSISSSAAARTADENLLMVFLGFAKIGTILSRYADASPADGVVDAGFLACASGSIPDSGVTQVGTAINLILDSLTNIGSSTVASGALTGVSTACGLMPAGYRFCASPYQVLTTDFDANEIKGIRTLLNESTAIGLSSCTGDVSTCQCP